MDRDALDRICELVKGDAYIDISDGYAITDTLSGNNIEYNGCILIDRYGHNLEILTGQHFEPEEDKIYTYTEYHTTGVNFDHFSLKSLYNDRNWNQCANMDTPVRITLENRNFDIDTLRYLLLTYKSLVILHSNVPCYIDGPLLKGLKCFVLLSNISLGRVAAEWYNNLMSQKSLPCYVKLDCSREIANFNQDDIANIDIFATGDITINNALTYQDNLDLLNVDDTLSLSLCNYNLPLLPSTLKRLNIKLMKYNNFTISDLNELQFLKIRGGTNAIVTLKNLPALRELELYGECDIYINSEITDRLSRLHVKGRTFEGIPLPGLDKLSGDITSNLLWNASNVREVVSTDWRVLSEWHIPSSIEILLYKSENFDGNAKEMVANFDNIVKLPNLKKVTFIVDLDYPLDPMSYMEDVVFDALFHYNGNMYTVSELSDDRQEFYELNALIQEHNYLVKRRSMTLERLSRYD